MSYSREVYNQKRGRGGYKDHEKQGPDARLFIMGAALGILLFWMIYRAVLAPVSPSYPHVPNAEPPPFTDSEPIKISRTSDRATTKLEVKPSPAVDTPDEPPKKKKYEEPEEDERPAPVESKQVEVSSELFEGFFAKANRNQNKERLLNGLGTLVEWPSSEFESIDEKKQLLDYLASNFRDNRNG